MFELAGMKTTDVAERTILTIMGAGNVSYDDARKAAIKIYSCHLGDVENRDEIRAYRNILNKLKNEI